MTDHESERTHGTLLGGRVRYAQPLRGWRTGIEPVLLAAAVPARPGDRVLEAGCGAGAGLLCLLWRVPAVIATGVELDDGTAALARENLRANGHAAQVASGNVTQRAAPGPFDHAFANPPWHDPAGTRPPDARRATATHGTALDAWIEALTAAVAGSVTLALPAAQAAVASGLLTRAGFGRQGHLLLRPKVDRAPKITLVQAWPGKPATCRVDELVLHEADGRFTAAADAILRGGAALPIRLQDG